MIEINSDNFKNNYDIYHLSLAASVAYYGDGFISREEMKYLISMADELLEPDILDRELVKKEVLLEILDSLKSAFDNVTSQEDRHQSVLAIAREISKTIAGIINSSSDRRYKKYNGYKKYKMFVAMTDKYEELAEIDGAVTDREREIVQVVKMGFYINIKNILVSGLIAIAVIYIFW